MAEVPNFKDCCEIVLANPVFTPKTDEYFRTASRDLVDLLKKLECKQCLEKERPEKTFSVAKPAVIAFCGHYVHATCLYIDGDETKKKYFICDACRKKEDESISGYASFQPVFTEFFEHIEQADGFRCKECKKLHPKGNVVKINGDDNGDRNGRKDRYLCVWCASTDAYLNHWLEQVGPGRPANRRTDKLHSVERMLHCSYYLNLQCCSCMKEVVWLNLVLRTIGIDDSYPHSHGDKKFKTAYLLCGHIRCEECNKGGPVYCNLCKCKQSKEIPETDAKNWARRSHVQEYVNSYDAPKAGGFVMSSECCECKKRHPEDNITTIGILLDPICMWCKVYKSLGEKTKWETAQKKKTSPHGKGAKYRKLSESSAEESSD